MFDMARLLERCARLQAQTGLSEVTLSKKIFGTPYKFRQLRSGASIRLDTLERALQRLDILERDEGMMEGAA